MIILRQTSDVRRLTISKSMRTLVIGDIHGQHRALRECLKLCGFDYEKDRLIALGDVCDRGAKVKESIDELLKVRHLVYLLGNHDAWTLEWAVYGQYSEDWMKQGGAETAASYEGIGMPEAHIALLAGAPLYFEEGKRLFVHAGFDAERGVKGTPWEVFIWDRTLAMEADKLHEVSPEFRIRGYDEIFIGHTPTTLFGETLPRKRCNVWFLDTGAGVGGKLTIMDIETKQYWQANAS